MLALEPTVVDAVWQSFAAYLPERGETEPSAGLSPAPDLGPRLLRGHLVPAGHRVQLGRGRTTGQRERDDAAASTRRVGGRRCLFEHLVEEAIAAFDKVIGLDLSEVSVDGSLHKAPMGGEGTGPNPTDRGKTGWKWSVATDTNGVPIGWVSDGANRNDSILLAPTLDDVARPRSALRHRDPLARSWL